MAFSKESKKNKYRTEDSGQKYIEYRPKYKLSPRDRDAERDLPKICRFCTSAHVLYDSDTMLCDRKGVVGCEYSCGKFVYDPLKHIPAQAPELTVHGDELMIEPEEDGTPDIFTDEMFAKVLGTSPISYSEEISE